MFSGKLFKASQKELFLLYIYVYIYIYIYMYIYTEWYDFHFQVHQMAWDTFGHMCKKAQKSVKKLERKYYTNNLYITDTVQVCNSSILYITHYFFGNWSWNFRIGVWKKAWFDTPLQSEQNIQICSLYVQTKYKFWKCRDKLI